MELKEKIKVTFKKVGNWLKTYWYLVAAVVVFIVGILFLRRSPLENLYQSLMGRYREQLEANQQDQRDLDALRQKERDRQAKIDREYQAELERIKAEHQDAIQNLSKEQEQDIKEIVERSGDNPEKMAEEVNAYFGLPVRKP